MQYTVRQLKAEIAAVAAELGKAVPTGLTKLRKADLEMVLATLREAAQAKRAREARQAVGEPKVYQGAMHENLDAVHAENPTALATAANRLGNSLDEISEASRKAAQALVPVAYGRMVAVVRSMGRTVRGKVVAAELRTPDEDGSGRVLLVVEHPNGTPDRKATRTLHRLVDVKLEPVTS